MNIMALLLTVAATTASALSHSVDVPLRGQLNGSWCWAAAADMALGNDPSEQCRLAASVTACTCSGTTLAGMTNTFNPLNSACYAGNQPDSDYLPKLLKSQTLPSGDSGLGPHSVSPKLVASELDAKRPVVFWWQHSASCSGEGHVAVVSALEERPGGEPFVMELDPWPEGAGDTYALTWRAFACGAANFGHCRDYYAVGGAETSDAEKEWVPANCAWGASDFVSIKTLDTVVANVLAQVPELRDRLHLDKNAAIDCEETEATRLSLAQADAPFTDLLATTRGRVLCKQGQREFSVIVENSTTKGQVAVLAVGGSSISPRIRQARLVAGASGQVLKEVFVPEAGQMILTDGLKAVRVTMDGLLTSVPFQDVLNSKVDGTGLGGETLRDRLKAHGHEPVDLRQRLKDNGALAIDQ